MSRPWVLLPLLLAACPTIDEPCTDCTPDTRPFGAPDCSRASNGSSVVSGRVTYDFVPVTYDPLTQTGGPRFELTERRPVRDAVIYVLDGNTRVGCGPTDADGRYVIGYDSSGGELQVAALTRTNSPPIQVEDNTDHDLPWGVVAPLTTGGQVDLHASSGWTGTSYDPQRRVAAAFAVLDSMWTASRAFLAVRQLTFIPLRVNWSPNNSPQAGEVTQGQIGTSHFNPRDKEIYVLGLAGADTDEFDSHVIVHEWGHFFENTLSRSDSPGGRHGPGDILDPRIAFGEAWGNAVASMVLPETIYADSAWANGQLVAFGFDTETEPSPTDDPTPSAFSESSVLRALFDLYDAPADGPFDQAALGLGPITDALTGPQRTTPSVTTLASFVTALKAQPGVSASAVDAVLARYNVGPVVGEFGQGDELLEGMFTPLDVPGMGTIALGGGNLPNTWQQNQYYVFEGTGARLGVRAEADQPVAITGLLRGEQIGFAQSDSAGVASFTFQSRAQETYVVVLTGLGEQPGDYPVTITVQ